MIPAAVLTLTLVFWTTTKNSSFIIPFDESMSAAFQFTFVETSFSNFASRYDALIFEGKIRITTDAFRKSLKKYIISVNSLYLSIDMRILRFLQIFNVHKPFANYKNQFFHSFYIELVSFHPDGYPLFRF